MNLSDLKKHAKKLKTEGYPISGYSKLHDTPEDISALRKMIRKAQKSSSGKSPSVKSVSPIKKSGCNPGFDNLTHCQKRTSVKQVKELAGDCGIDTNIFNTKPKQCAELIRVQGGGLKTKSSGKKSPKKKDSSTSIDETDEYKKLNKMKKKDDDGDDLLNMARKLKITYSNQDGENISIGKLRKHELILAIINKKGKVSPKKKSKKKTTPPVVSQKKKSKKKTPPPVVSPKKKSKKKTETTSSDEVLIREKLLKQVVLATGRSNNFYKDWNAQDLKDRLEAIMIDRENEKERRNRLKQITSMTGENNNFYKDYSLDELADKLDELTYSLTVNKNNELKDRRAMIKQIISITGENKSVYKNYNFDEVIDKLDEIRDLSSSKPKSSDLFSDEEEKERRNMIQKIISITRGLTDENNNYYNNYTFDELTDKIRNLSSSKPKSSDSSSDEDKKVESADESSDDDEPLLPADEKSSAKNVAPKTDESEDDSSEDEKQSIVPAKNVAPKTDESSSEDESSEESSEDEKPSIVPVKKNVVPVSEDSSDDESSEESDRPSEGTEVVDVESTLANVIAGNKKIGELAKVQRSVLKCMGLLS